jgi:hypothetical protein
MREKSENLQRFRVVIYKNKEIIYSNIHTFPNKGLAEAFAEGMKKLKGGDDFRVFNLAR